MRILIVGDATTFDDHAHDSAGPEHPDALRPTHCRNAGEAVAAMEGARIADMPVLVAFVGADADGVDAACRLRALDPDINLVVIADDPDAGAAAIGRIAGPPDRTFLLARSLAPVEAGRMALALGRRWRHECDAATARAALAARVALLEERVAELAANESRAMHLATHDSLTDAPNRLAFQRALAARARRAGRFAIAMVDLDRFKLVNDTLGHLAGDALIRAMCATLQRSAPADAIVARLGGDEFGILFDVADGAAAVAAGNRVVAACALPFAVFGHRVQGGASAGLVVIDGGVGCDPADALRRADLALNAAKQAGKGVTRLFDEGMDEGVRFRRGIEEGLAEAIARGELDLAFQPIVGRDRFEIVGFEALLRWNTDRYGPISPATFIPIADESTLIHALGDWVVARALDQVALWPDQYVSINFSPRQFRRSDFVDHLSAAVGRAGVAPGRVQVEITECAIFDDADRAAATLRRLREAGFRIALDDFGTGYSSLHNIRKFALDGLKIDRSFIDGMGRERESAAIVHSIIHLGRALGLGVVAEGVETAAQVQALRIAGANQLQGWFVARPVDGATAAAMAAAGSLGGEGDVEARPHAGTRV